MSHSTLTRSIRLSLTALLLILVLMARTVSAATTEYTIPVTYDQTSARSMLSMVNEFRTGSDAWYYNSDGSVHTCTGLSEYTYDYNLEQIAMQRAYEIAVSFDHTRPDGSDCYTCTYNGTRSYGENIAAGTRTAESTFEIWQETNEDYTYQGHRRAMLSSGYSAIGIGHVVYRGTHYWVQEFGIANSGATVTPEVNDTLDKTVSVNTSYMALNTVLSKSSMTVYMDQASAALPTVEANVRLTEGWGTAGILLQSSEYTATWAVTDPAIASVSGDSIVPLSPGTTTVTVTVTYGSLTQTKSISLTVAQRPLSQLTYERPVTQIYTGSPIEPAVTFMNGDYVLVEGTDYTLSYSNNVNPGTATITVTGIGNYTGTKSLGFMINRRNIAEVTVAPIASQTYTGSAITPAISLSYNGTELTANTDYQIYSTSFTNAGTYNITIYGRGNFCESTTVSFTVDPRPIAEATIAPIDNKVYTGSTYTPSLTVAYNGISLYSGRNYTVAYTDNINAGTATVTLTGTGNFTGTTTTSFTINPRDISSAYLSPIPSQAYTGAEITPAVTITYGSRQLTAGAEYNASYSNNINAGTATVTVTGIGNFTGVRTANFVITAPPPDPVTPDPITPDPVTPDPVTPDPVNPDPVDPVLPDDPPAPEGTVNMYRLYNINSGEHFYTSNAGERNTLITLGWRYEGIGWTAPSYSNTPVYRLYNRYGGEHHYTMSAGERDVLINAGWDYEGIGWYSDDNQTVPLYRQYNPNAYSNNHNYTTSLGENNYLVSIGWRDEGVAWYGV